mgnify:CR=1 FL=1
MTTKICSDLKLKWGKVRYISMKLSMNNVNLEKEILENLRKVKI